MITRFYFFLSLLVFLFDVQSQSLIGRVVDAETNLPIEHANVVILGTTSGVYTNSAGYFELKMNKKITLVISHVSYQPVQVAMEKRENILIKLSPKVLTLSKPFILPNYTSDSLTSDFTEADEIPLGEEEKIDEVFTVVESNSNYHEGWENFYVELANQLKNEKLPKDLSCHVEFTLKSDSSIDDLEVGYDSSGVEEIMNTAISKLDGWIPATQRGKLVDQRIQFALFTTEVIFTLVEQSATFPGGITAYYEYLASELRYPREAQRMGIEGHVFVQFIVERDGSLSDIHVVKGIGAGCDEEAVRVLKNSPKWEPGMQRGEPVRQKMIQNILFRFASSNQKIRQSGNTMRIPINLRSSLNDVNVAAEFPRGREGFKEFISKNRIKIEKVPPPNNQNNLVVLEFDVDSIGQLSNLEIISGLGDPFDKEATRLFETMPNWIPAMKEDKPCQSRSRINISFTNIPDNKIYCAGQAFDKANNFFKQGYYEKSIIWYTKAIDRNPSDLNFYFNRAAAYIKTEQIERACTDLKLIRERDEESAKLVSKYCE